MFYSSVLYLLHTWGMSLQQVTCYFLPNQSFHINCFADCPSSELWIDGTSERLSKCQAKTGGVMSPKGQWLGALLFILTGFLYYFTTLFHITDCSKI